MEKFIIHGQRKLSGTVSISGSKNAALPILAASVMAKGAVTLSRIPHLSDICVMCEILSALGCRVTQTGPEALTVHTEQLTHPHIPYELTGRLRGSFLFLGPLLARTGHATIAMPGGCPIGSRPVDLHIKGLTALGAACKNIGGCIKISARHLKGANIYLDFPSVGATENILCAATLAEGTTIIENAAVEPEIVDLADFLCSMGANIVGAGTDTIKIVGVSRLQPGQYTVMADRIEAGTLLMAAAATGGHITVTHMNPEDLSPVTAKLSEMHIPITIGKNSITLGPCDRLRAVDIKTLPFPGFPTDMQAQMTVLLSLSKGTGMITETIFENRFMHTGELCRMGASIKVTGRSAVIEGRPSLNGAKVKATDLRAGAALVIAGLAAKGDTEISDIYHVDRGYAALDEKLRLLGADISRTEE